MVEFAPTTVASRKSPVAGSMGGRWLTKRIRSVSVFLSSRTSKPWRFKVLSPLMPEKFSTDIHLIREASRPGPRVSRIAILSVKPRAEALRRSILLILVVEF